MQTHSDSFHGNLLRSYLCNFISSRQIFFRSRQIRLISYCVTNLRIKWAVFVLLLFVKAYPANGKKSLHLKKYVNCPLDSSVLFCRQTYCFYFPNLFGSPFLKRQLAWTYFTPRYSWSIRGFNSSHTRHLLQKQYKEKGSNYLLPQRIKVKKQFKVRRMLT